MIVVFGFILKLADVFLEVSWRD